MKNDRKKISSLISKIAKNKKLQEMMIGISNDHCISQKRSNDLDFRNNLFMFLGTALALLSFTEVISLKKKSKYITKENLDIDAISNAEKLVKNNANLNNLITEIVKNETVESQSQVENHLFLVNALVFLVNRNVIEVNSEWNHKNPYNL
jgi:hypothetical protein